MLENDLMIGSTGSDVKVLQEKLKILGFYNPVVTGSFGLSTEIGVKAFQEEYGDEVTGVVNNEMWEKLFLYTEKSNRNVRVTSLALGDSGSSVSELQRKLQALLYYDASINGVYDAETENAVKRFQYNNDITTTGIVNEVTSNLIDSLYGNINDCVLGSNENNDNDNNNYIVKSGDTLYSIARQFNTSVSELISLNNLTTNILSIGQVLKIPNGTASDDSSSYTVKKGDTLYGIAREFNTTVNDIISLNNLTSNNLSIGQVLKIPGANNSTTYETYIVKSGDTLYSVARRYGLSVDELKRINSLTSNNLSIGQTLKVPSNTFTTYTVKSGDTLYSIANRYNTTVSSIKSLNNLVSNNLSIGQVLLID